MLALQQQEQPELLLSSPDQPDAHVYYDSSQCVVLLSQRCTRMIRWWA